MSIISVQSHVFCTTVPQADNVEKYDGVPFVHTFDMAQDLEHLFEVIYMRR